MTEQQVFEIVQKHLTTIVPHIKPDQVARDASMRDLGASSLDIVEVVSCSMRELRVRVPRAEMAGLKDIGGLVQLLHASVQKSAVAHG